MEADGNVEADGSAEADDGRAEANDRVLLAQLLTSGRLVDPVALLDKLDRGCPVGPMGLAPMGLPGSPTARIRRRDPRRPWKRPRVPPTAG